MSTPVHMCETCRDQPGSDTAREKGCVCPVLDNGHGHRGIWSVRRSDCPMHGFTSDVQP